MKKILLYALPAIGIVAILYLYLTKSGSDSMPAAGPADTDSHWTWKNPLTSGEAVIPSDWKQGSGKGTRDALLTLTHFTGESVVYIINEKSDTGLKLEEYAGMKKEAMQRELGIESVEPVNDEHSYYRGEGAKYFGDTIAGTQVKIWSTAPGSFWRAAAITDLEYKNLEYRARKILDLLRETTL